jgi:ASC-1-like (ASCH) protein
LGIKDKTIAGSIGIHQALSSLKIIVHEKINFEQTKSKVKTSLREYEDCGNGDRDRCREKIVCNKERIKHFMENGRDWEPEYAENAWAVHI